MIYANGHFCKWDSNSDRADANPFQINICPSDKSSEAHRNSLLIGDRIHNIPIVIRYSRTSQTNSAAVRRYLWFDGYSLPLRTAQVLSRFPTQNRCDQARQQASAGTARIFYSAHVQLFLERANQRIRAFALFYVLPYQSVKIRKAPRGEI